MRISLIGLSAALLLSGVGCSELSGLNTRNNPPSSTVIPPNTPTVDVSIGDPLETDPTMHSLMLGVISGPENFSGQDMSAQYTSIGVTSVRNNDYYDDRLDLEQIFTCGGSTYPSWEGCDPQDPSNYNWTASDAEFASWIASGFTPFLRLGGEWENASRNHDFKGPQNALQEQNWIAAAIRTTDRYLTWEAKPNSFTYLNIWTEFPGEHFWDRSNVAFINFFVDAYQQLKAEFPELRIGGPGFNAGVSMQVMEGESTLADGLLKALYEKNIHLDWLGWHTFTDDPTIVEQQAAAWQSLLDGTGPYASMPWAGTGFFHDTEVIVDAYGNGGSSSKTATPITTAAGAADLTASWIALQNADIQGAYYYRGNEAGDGSSRRGVSVSQANEGTRLGLIAPDGSLTKGAQAFHLWSIASDNQATILSTQLSSSEDTEFLSVLASVTKDGTHYLLLSNYGSENVSVRPTLQGDSLSEFPGVVQWLVDETHSGDTAESLVSDQIMLPAQSVLLVKIP